MRYLSGHYLFDPAGPFHFALPAVVFFVLMGVIGSFYAYYVSETNNKRAPITRMSERVQAIAWTITVIGLILIGLRWGDAQIPLVQSRIVLYIAALGFLALIFYVAWWLRFVLPAKNAAYEARLLRRQYQPRARRRH